MERKVNLESIITEIGYIGRTQSFYFALICFIVFFTGCFNLMNSFTAGDLNYRCYIDGCDKSSVDNSEYNPGWIKYAVPFDTDTELPEKCLVYEFTGVTNNLSDLCDASAFNDKTINKCNKFVFETEEKTILIDFDLKCKENKWKLTLPGTVQNAGKCLNMLLIGYFSDRFGRKKVFIASTIVASTFAMGQMLAFNYWWFLVFTFLETCLGGSTYAIGLVLSLELVSPKYRTAVGSFTFAIAATGTIYLGLAAMLVLNWKTLLLVCYVPNFIVITYIWLLPESITWLQMKGRYKEIANILLKIIKWNKIEVSPESFDVLAHKPERMFDNSIIPETPETNKNNDFPIREVFRSRAMMLRILSMGYCWLATLFIFYGMSRISVAIGENKFTDFIISSAMEIPACALVTLISNRVGRKTIVCAAFFVSGSALIIYTFVSNIYWLKMVLFMIGKFAITMSFCTIYIYVPEMMPTNLRQTLLGVCSAMGRIGSLTAPQAPLLEAMTKHLSIYLFAGFGIVAGLMALRFPETLNCKLPDTIEEALQIGKRKENQSNVT